MLENFVAYRISREVYWICKELRLPNHLKEQLLKASSSIALNLAEGSGKKTAADQQKFYSIAAGSLRECQAIIDLEKVDNPRLRKLVAQLGAMTFKLSHPQRIEKISKKTPGISEDQD